MKPADYTNPFAPIPCACGCGVQAVPVRIDGRKAAGCYGWAKRIDDNSIDISALTWPTTDEAFADGHRYFGRVQ
jgi:hypothetical protein